MLLNLKRNCILGASMLLSLVLLNIHLLNIQIHAQSLKINFPFEDGVSLVPVFTPVFKSEPLPEHIIEFITGRSFRDSTPFTHCMLTYLTISYVNFEGEDSIGHIGRGYVALLGVGSADDETVADKLIEKIKKLRLFADEEGKTNRSITDIQGELLVVSQFTLYADCRKGNRPSFTDAAPPDRAKALYEYFVAAATPHFAKVAHGSFGAGMQVELVNDGPFTIVLEI